MARGMHGLMFLLYIESIKDYKAVFYCMNYIIVFFTSVTSNSYSYHCFARVKNYEKHHINKLKIKIKIQTQIFKDE